MHPLFVSFYTPDYEDCALELGRDCQRLGVDCRIVAVKDNCGCGSTLCAQVGNRFSNWMEATYAKAFFVKAALDQLDEINGCQPEDAVPYDSVVWVDADARMRSVPVLLYDCVSWDIAAHRFNGRELLSGTVGFANNAKAREVVAAWCQYNSGEISCLEQRNLDHAITDTPGVRFLDLPAEYAFIFDLSRKQHPDAVPVIEHMQRSRQTRRRERRCARQSR